MRKAFKYIILFSAVMLTFASVQAKEVKGIQPVNTPKEAAKEANAWITGKGGAALMDLEGRYPEKKLRSLVQADGIVNYAPEKLIGIPGATVEDKGSIINKLSRRRIPGGSNLCGFVGYNELDLEVGFYRIPLSTTQELTTLHNCASMLYSFRGGGANDKYYVMSYYGTTIVNGEYYCLTAIFDTETWNLIAEEGDYGDYGRICTDLTYDPTTERFYGCFLNDGATAYTLGYMQYDDNLPANTISNVVHLCELPVSLNGIACDQNGVLYGIRNDNGQLVTINKKTGEMTTVTSTAFVPDYNGSLTYDSTNDIFYWSIVYADATATSGLSSAVVSVDKTTGELQHVYDFSQVAQTMGLYTEFTPVKDAPGAFSNLTVDFEGESLSGYVTFDAPTTYDDGTSASGDLSYMLTAVKSNGYEAVNETLTCQYGQTAISVPVTVLTSGNYTFTLQGFNDSGKGYPVTVRQYLGSDIPESVDNVEISLNDNVVTVTWDDVNTTVNGGYYDPATKKYVVTLAGYDSNGNATGYISRTISDGTTATWETAIEDTLIGFQATVTPYFGSNQGDTTSSGFAWFGALEVPFDQSMTASVDGWTSVCLGGYPWVRTSQGSTGSGWSCPYIWGNYNTSWLFSPKIKLEKGKYYTFTYTTWSTIINHTLHAYIGQEMSADGMTTKLSDYTVTPNSSTPRKYVVTFGYEAPEDGYYYLGILNDTASNTYTNKPYCFINNVTCVAAPDSSPAAPEMTVDYNKSGEYSAEVTIVAPDKTFAGETLEKLDQLTLSVDGTAVQTWEEITPGETVSYTYEATKAGNYTFKATATNDGVDGASDIETVYLGLTTPLDPEWVSAAEQADTKGTVDITWAPVTELTNGQEVDPDAVSYNMINIVTNSYIEREVTEQPYVWKACEPDEQNVVLVSANAKTSGGTSSTYGTYSSQGLQCVGAPYSLPFRETFDGGYVHYSWTVVNRYSSYDAVYVVKAEDYLATPNDANGDGYLLWAFVPYANSSAGLYSGRITIPADANQPVISFAVYREYYSGSTENKNVLNIGVIGNKTSGYLTPITYDSQDYGWKYYYYDMSSFKGQSVNLLLTFETHGYTSHYIDDIRLFDALDHDLTATGITMPSDGANPDERTRIIAEVSNIGAKSVSAGEATVELTRLNDNVVVATADVPALSPFETNYLRMYDTLNPSFDSEVRYRATIVYDNDEDISNNSCEDTLALNIPFMPAPENLAGERNDNGFASLTWDEPDLSPNYEAYSINFDDSTVESTEDLGGFKSVDRDGNEVDEDVLGISGVRGFTTFHHYSLSRSGEWMLTSCCNKDGAAKEDWLISPELSGDPQTISFYVRTYWNCYESYSVLVSYTGDEVEDFTETVYDGKTSDNNWNQIKVDLPQGAKYFAILCKADDTTDLIYLMLDDFEFNGKDKNEGLEVVGYNTYRNNEAIGSLGIDRSWEDLDNEPGMMYYRVTALYDGLGESGPSNEVFLFTRGSDVDGVDAITGKVYGEQERIIIEGADGLSVTITDLKGIVVYSNGNASSKETAIVASGVYIVTIDGKSVKLQVR